MTGAKGAVEGSLNRRISRGTSTTSPLTVFTWLPARLTLDEVELCQEFQLLGDVQLEVSEGRVGIQGEVLEIVDGFAEPAAGRDIRQRRSYVYTDSGHVRLSVFHSVWIFHQRQVSFLQPPH